MEVNGVVVSIQVANVVGVGWVRPFAPNCSPSTNVSFFPLSKKDLVLWDVSFCEKLVHFLGIRAFDVWGFLPLNF